MMTTPETAALTPTVLLDDLLLDAQTELESVGLPSLSQAVAVARMVLVRRHLLEQQDPPIEIAESMLLDPDAPAPVPTLLDPKLELAETVAHLFHDRYEELAPSFGYVTRETSRRPWTEVPATQRNLMIATAAAVLADVPTLSATNSL